MYCHVGGDPHYPNTCCGTDTIRMAVFSDSGIGPSISIMLSIKLHASCDNISIKKIVLSTSHAEEVFIITFHAPVFIVR
jgi:hypothetical protein